MTRLELPEEMRQLNKTLKGNPQLTEGMGSIHLLSVPGRTSGKLRSTPVSLLDYDGKRWLVAGTVGADWVKNIRVSGWGILIQGKHCERVTVGEVAPEERAPLLQVFVQRKPLGRFAFTAGPDEPLEAFAVIAADHPVFQIGEAHAMPNELRGVEKMACHGV